MHMVYYIYLYIMHPKSYYLIIDHSCFFSLLTSFSLWHALLSFSHSPNIFTNEKNYTFLFLFVRYLVTPSPPPPPPLEFKLRN